jgi:small-conductance mechanosensitive channel
MTLRDIRKKSGRYSLSFDVGEILLYGVPVWLGAPALGWYFAGATGLKSATVGLVIVAFYIAAEIFAAERFKVIRDNGKAIAFLIGSLIARIAVLLVASYLMYRFTAFNLLALLLTVVAGFTAMLFISTKNWLNEHNLVGKG